MDNCYLDALAVITFFKMSDKKHLFITGDRGSGKSYLLNNILNQIEETMDMSDFFNYLLSRRTDTPEVVIKSNLIDDGKEYVIGRPRTLTPVSPKKGNNMTSVEDGFINCACPAIMKLIIIALRKYYWCACVFVEGKPAYLIIIINIIIGIAGFICAVTSKKISCTGCFSSCTG